MGGVATVSAFLFTVVLSAGLQQAPPSRTDLKIPDSQQLHSGRSRRFRIVPEYDRYMERVAVSMSDRDPFPIYHDEILSSLPDYTAIDLIVPSSHLTDVNHWLEGKAYRDRVRPVVYDPQYRKGARLYLLLPDEEQLVAVDTNQYRLGSQQGTLWAQDLFEVATTSDNRTLLLTACAHKCFQSEMHRHDSRVVSDNAYLACLDTEATEVCRLPLAFKGGNVLVDELAGRRIVFCGHDSVRSTRTAWRAFEGEDISDARVTEMLKKAFDADTAIILGGPRPQPEVMYHLDQAMLPLGDGAIAVTSVVGECPRLEPDASRIRHAEAFQARLRPILSDMGYRVVNLESTVSNALKYQHYVNAIPYVDKTTGQKSVLMPVFPETQTQLDQQVVSKNVKTLESLGYSVVCVPTQAYKLTGGIHCLVNVLQ